MKGRVIPMGDEGIKRRTAGPNPGKFFIIDSAHGESSTEKQLWSAIHQRKPPGYRSIHHSVNHVLSPRANGNRRIAQDRMHDVILKIFRGISASRADSDRQVGTPSWPPLPMLSPTGGRE